MRRLVNNMFVPDSARRLLIAATLASFSGLCTTVVIAAEVEGYTEPNRSVDVAAHDQGVLLSLPVQVGDFVEAGQVVAQLDDVIHRILMESAAERKGARGQLNSAEAELKLKTTRLRKLTELRESGFGRKEEVERAQADRDIAAAELQSVQEELADQALQYEKFKAELERRVVHAPISGYVATRLKEPGEFVAPQEPNVLTIVELNPLLAKFSMRRSLAKQLSLGDSVTIKLGGYGKTVVGIVDQISPVVDAQSGTIKVKVRLDNSDGKILSGERCTIDIPDDQSDSGDELETAVLVSPPARRAPSKSSR